ncbi:uncharacterized protein LOC134679086 [Cydia fagiglandana]|uniref:uncharacterized protein LOC134679086 n=1 Tax=Cydia fagiglandana TaxID=1458189 RepID=UPI002FEE303C
MYGNGAFLNWTSRFYNKDWRAPAAGNKSLLQCFINLIIIIFVGFFSVDIFCFTAIALVVGMAYMWVELFIKQYTQRLDWDQNLSPVLKGITVALIMQYTLFCLLSLRYAGDGARYLSSSFASTPIWSTCTHFVNTSHCMDSEHILQYCEKPQPRELLTLNVTSVHIYYMEYMKTNIRGAWTWRFFVVAVMWILNFCLTTVPDTVILKFYKYLVLLKHIFSIFTYAYLAISTGRGNEAFLELMDVNADGTIGGAVYMVALVYGVGMIGFHDFGSTSPFTMTDNAVIIFTVLFILLASLRSMLVNILLFQLSDCVDINRDEARSWHYIFFVLLPLSTEFLFGQKLINIYLYLHVLLSLLPCLVLYSLTVTRLLHSEFPSLKFIYIQGLICLFGFILSVPILLVGEYVDKMRAGLISGLSLTVLYLGGLRMAIIMWIYGVKRFSTDINFWLGFSPTKFWTVCWSVLPAILWVSGLCAVFKFIGVIYRLRPPKLQRVTIQLRSFARLDIQALQRDARAVDWSSTLTASSVDEAVAALNSSVLKLFDIHAPIRTVRLKRPPAPWFTRESGFRRGHSTSTALLKVVDDVRLGMDSSLLTVLVLIDFSNAFNAVNHDLLLATLRHLNISSSAAGWFSSYLQDRRQALYTQASAKDLDQAIAEINLDLNHISTWSHCFGITVNPAKCQAILLGSTRLLSLVNTVELAPVLFETEVIPLSSQVKNLGLTIDSGLTWEPQVSDILFGYGMYYDIAQEIGHIETRYALIWYLVSAVITFVFQIRIIVRYAMKNNLIGAFRNNKKYGPSDKRDRKRRRRYDPAIDDRHCFHDCISIDEEIDCNHLPLMNTGEGPSSMNSESTLTQMYESVASRADSVITIMEMRPDIKEKQA